MELLHSLTSINSYNMETILKMESGQVYQVHCDFDTVHIGKTNCFLVKGWRNIIPITLQRSSNTETNDQIDYEYGGGG